MYIPERKPSFDSIVDNALGQIIPVVEQAGGIDWSQLIGWGVIALSASMYLAARVLKAKTKAEVKESSDSDKIIDMISNGRYYKEMMNNNPWGHLVDGVNLAKGEVVLYACRSSYLRDRVIKHYKGKSAGLGFRVMKGVNFRVGASKGVPVDVRETIHESDGVFILTNRAIYFKGDKKSLRILHGKIVHFESDGKYITVNRDAVTAYPQHFSIAGAADIVERLMADVMEGVDFASYDGRTESVDAELSMAMMESDIL